MSAVTGNEQLIGQRLGRYRVSSSLGLGGMAEVFQASDERLSREVAIKVVLPAYGSEPELLKRFLREARTVASLEHPNILPIYDFGERDGLPYLVMPLIQGGTLADRLEGGRIEPPRVAGFIRELARALDAAHAAGVLHRDVKPGNVLVGRDDHLFLADFGIAQLSGATRLTRTGAMVGTPIYMAPEVAAGEPASPSSDLYSLAVMSYEMLAGRPPFEGENALSVLHQHATRPVPPLTGRLAHLPAGVDRVLEHGLAKDPAARPATCHAFGELLAEQLPGAGAEALPAAAGTAMESHPTLELTPDPAAVATPAGETLATPHPTAGGRRSWRWAWASLLAIVVLAGVLALAWKGLPGRTHDVSVRVVTADAPADAQPATAAGPEAATPPAEVTAEPPAEVKAEPPAVEAPAADPEVSPPPAKSRPIAGGRATSRLARSPGGAPTHGELVAGRDRLRALRAFSSRTTEADFRSMLEAAQRLSGHGAAGLAEAISTYARGGLAYLAGDAATGAANLRDALEERRFVAHWGASPLMLLASSEPERESFEPWELALGYGDPRGTAGETLDALLLGQPENARLRFARALVHRLDAEHSAVIRHAVPVFHQLDKGDAPEARGYLAQVIGDAYLDLGRGEEALQWFGRAFELGGPLRGIAAMRGAEAARQLRRPEQMTEFLRRACDADVQPACRRLGQSPRRLRER